MAMVLVSFLGLDPQKRLEEGCGTRGGDPNSRKSPFVEFGASSRESWEEGGRREDINACTCFEANQVYC